jgi:predicted nucleotidyltransferase
MSETFDVDDVEWCTITTTQRIRQPTILCKENIVSISYEELVETLKSKMSGYKNNIIAGYIYGSRARGTNRIDSDADILMFWKNEMMKEELQSIRDEIESTLGFSVDFVSCIYRRKFIECVDERDIAYFENVSLDAKQFIGTPHNIMWLSECSQKCKKLSRK